MLTGQFVYCTLSVHQVYARDVTAVSPIALALFGGRLKIYERHSVVAIEGKDGFMSVRSLISMSVRTTDPKFISSLNWIESNRFEIESNSMKLNYSQENYFID